MYFAVAKLLFADEGKTSHDAKEVASMVEKIRARFKIAVKPYNGSGENSGTTGIVIAAVGQSAHQMEQLIDEVAELCEVSGFGRIDDEQALIENFDDLDFEPEE